MIYFVLQVNKEHGNPILHICDNEDQVNNVLGLKSSTFLDIPTNTGFRHLDTADDDWGIVDIDHTKLLANCSHNQIAHIESMLDDLGDDEQDVIAHLQDELSKYRSILATLAECG